MNNTLSARGRDLADILANRTNKRTTARTRDSSIRRVLTQHPVNRVDPLRYWAQLGDHV